MAYHSDQKGISQILKTVEEENNINDAVKEYKDCFDDICINDKKVENVACMTKKYYDLASDFYEYGWGESFHFAAINKHDTPKQSLLRQEFILATKMGLEKGDYVLDLGCGIGGPARHISSQFGCHITGININQHQVNRCRELTKKVHLDHLIDYIEADFTDTRLPSASFDHAYGIEATCHASDISKVYGEAYRLLKPGGIFAIFEWVMTDKFDSSNPQHVKIKQGICAGNSLLELSTSTKAVKVMEKVGFHILEAQDCAETSEIPWYSMLQPRWTFTDFKMTPLGRCFTHLMLNCFQMLHLVPQGSVQVHKMLCEGADYLVKGGQLGIFTPMFLIVAQKPVICDDMGI